MPDFPPATLSELRPLLFSSDPPLCYKTTIVLGDSNAVTTLYVPVIKLFGVTDTAPSTNKKVYGFTPKVTTNKYI
jgi:hypothetical protein